MSTVATLFMLLGATLSFEKQYDLSIRDRLETPREAASPADELPVFTYDAPGRLESVSYEK